MVQLFPLKKSKNNLPIFEKNGQINISKEYLPHDHKIVILKGSRAMYMMCHINKHKIIPM